MLNRNGGFGMNVLVKCKNNHKFKVEIDNLNEPTGDEWLCEICLKEKGEYNNGKKEGFK